MASVISMESVSHTYGRGSLRKQVLFDVSAEIHPGEIVIIVGPSGSGKTTLLTLAGALRSVQQGHMKVLGRELNGATSRTLVEIRKEIGYIFQAHNLLASLTASENVRTGLTPLRRRGARAAKEAAAMLKEVGLEGREASRPGQMSGGQRQRVAIARALVGEPKLVLADEPTASLDRTTGREVVEILRRLARNKGAAILLVTHDSRILDIADRVMTLEDGRLSSFGQALSADAGHLMTALKGVGVEDLTGLWAPLSEQDFLDVMQRLRSEAEQFLNVMEFGDTAEAHELFGALARSVLHRAALAIGACRGAITSHGAVVVELGAELARGPGSVSLPVRNRHAEPIGLVEFTAKSDGSAFTAADERTLRDFERALGLLIEGWRRCDHRLNTGL